MHFCVYLYYMGPVYSVYLYPLTNKCCIKLCHFNHTVFDVLCWHNFAFISKEENMVYDDRAIKLKCDLISREKKHFFILSNR